MNTAVRQFAYALLLLLLLLPGGAAQAAPVVQTGAEARLRDFIARMRSLRADFRQQLFAADGHLQEDARGGLVLSRPGRFRWDYRTPHVRVVAADGVHVWLYEADLQQVTERSYERTVGNTPAALLAGVGELDEHFSIAGTESRDGIAWVKLRSLSDEADFAGVAVGFSGRRLAALELSDRLGQRTLITFSRVQLNPRIDDTLFRFTPPAGTDVVREDEL